MTLSKNTRKNVFVVTGGIGSGKSRVCQILSKSGAKIISADELARVAISNVKNQVQAKFNQVFDNSGNLDRKKLAEIVFSDNAKKLELEKILHPEIQKLADLEFAQALKSSNKFIVYECPLFFEAGLKKEDYRAVIVVDLPEEIAIERACIRDGLSRENVKKRITMQVSRDERKKNADFVIDNSGTLEQLEANVLNLIKTLV